VTLVNRIDHFAAALFRIKSLTSNDLPVCFFLDPTYPRSSRHLCWCLEYNARHISWLIYLPTMFQTLFPRTTTHAIPCTTKAMDIAFPSAYILWYLRRANL